MFINAEFG